MREITLTRGAVTTVDDDDYEWLSRFKWYCASDGYVMRSPGRKQKKWIMHRLILAAPRGIYVDHINCDRLDNRRCNLRLATNSQNQANRAVVITASGRRGVTFHKCGKWQAQIKVNGRSIYLGLHETKDAAADAYSVAAKTYFGEYAHKGAA